jgi:hypothetical protein
MSKSNFSFFIIIFLIFIFLIIFLPQSKLFQFLFSFTFILRSPIVTVVSFLNFIALLLFILELYSAIIWFFVILSNLLIFQLFYDDTFIIVQIPNQFILLFKGLFFYSLQEVLLKKCYLFQVQVCLHEKFEFFMKSCDHL